MSSSITGEPDQIVIEALTDMAQLPENTVTTTPVAHQELVTHPDGRSIVATIDDVARTAGVSTSTVSYVLSGKRSISAPTRARVERAIAKLGYRPHAGARALASARTQVIALMAPLHVGVSVPVIMQFVAGVVTRARNFEYDVLLLTQDDVSGLERVSGGSMVDALVMMDIGADDQRVPLAAAARQPTVLIGLPQEPKGLSCVDLDFEAAGRLAVRHLTETGHTDLALIGSPPEVLRRHTSYAERLMQGLRHQATASQAQVTVEACDSSPAGASSAVDTLLANAPQITGIIVHNEGALPHVLSRLNEHGLKVGTDVSVVAVCPTDVALAQRIPMTSIDLPAQDIGKVAVDMVMARLEGDQPSETRLLTPRLTERASSTRLSPKK